MATERAHHRAPAELLLLSYKRVLIPDPDSGTYTALIEEFPGCLVQGGSEEEALRLLAETAVEWIEAALAEGLEIPPPTPPEEYSGRIALRLPRSYHRRLSELAQRERTSLNQLIVAAVAEKLSYTRIASDLFRELKVLQKLVASGSAGTAAAPRMVDSGLKNMKGVGTRRLISTEKRGS
jgi:antitoxin HicB